MIRISDVKPVGSGGGGAGGRAAARLQKAQKKVASTPDAAVVLSDLLTDAIAAGATTVHVEPHGAEARVRYRVDGVLREGRHIASNIVPQLAQQVKSVMRGDTTEDRVPQEGRFETTATDRRFAVRASLLPVADGEKIVLHIIDQTDVPRDLERLGYWGRSLRELQQAAERAHGLVIIGGPAGAGKTATLYGLLHMLIDPARNIATIEDAIEHRLPGINQTPVNIKAGMSYASAVRAVVQQDPNVVMVSDVHDTETAGMVVRTALAGRLLLAGMTSRDAAASVAHYVTMGIEPYLLASATKVIANQRLVRRLCSDCRERYTPGKDDMAAACAATGLHPQSALEHIEELEQTAAADLGIKGVAKSVTDGTVQHLWRAKAGGCAACGGTGFRGRIVLAEVMVVNTTMQKLIFSSATAEVLYQQAVADGMVPLPLDGFVKAALGLTSVEEVLRVAAVEA